MNYVLKIETRAAQWKHNFNDGVDDWCNNPERTVNELLEIFWKGVTERLLPQDQEVKEYRIEHQKVIWEESLERLYWAAMIDSMKSFQNADNTIGGNEYFSHFTMRFLALHSQLSHEELNSLFGKMNQKRTIIHVISEMIINDCKQKLGLEENFHIKKISFHNNTKVNLSGHWVNFLYFNDDGSLSFYPTDRQSDTQWEVCNKPYFFDEIVNLNVVIEGINNSQ